MPGVHLDDHLLRPLGKTGLRCHPMGFGCYRVSDGNAAHEEALREFLARGGNLIDTSANYGDGGSEVLVGKVLRDIARDRVIVVTKGGYIQGQNMALALRRKFPEVVEYGQGIWHSIHPDFLETQITMSAERMQQSYIDVYLLHNPEYYLEDQAHRGGAGKKEHDEFYRRVKEAFRFLEAKVAEGKIGWYGVSSNNFGMPGASPTMTSVERCWQTAEELTSSHHFRVVQLPLNLYETGGALEANNSGKTVLEFCQSKGVAVLINRPLNAFSGNRLIRLADFLRPGETPPGIERLHAILEPLLQMELKLMEQQNIPLIYGDQNGIAVYLETIVPQMKSLAHWQEIFADYVIQPVEQWATQCQQLYADRPEWKPWWQEFATKLSAAFQEISRYLAASQQSASDQLRSLLADAGYPKSNQSLSRMAQNVLLHLPGVSCVLNGMRRADYVADSMGAAELAPVDSIAILKNYGQPLNSATGVRQPE